MNISHQSIKTDLTDQEIISRVLNGDHFLYEALIRRYNTQLYRISFAIVQDEMEAEDIMQTAYINAFRALAGFQNKCSFSSWLTRILINESTLRKKKKMQLSRVLSDQVLKVSHLDTPLRSLMNKELKTLLEKAVSNLPEKYRLVFVLREVQEMSTLETMEVLNIGESNVKVRLNRAKEMLRNELSNYYRSNELFEFNLVRCDRIADFVMKRIIEAPQP